MPEVLGRLVETESGTDKLREADPVLGEEWDMDWEALSEVLADILAGTEPEGVTLVDTSGIAGSRVGPEDGVLDVTGG